MKNRLLSLALAVLAGAFPHVVSAQETAARGTITAVKGRATLHSGDAAGLPAAVGQTVPAGAVLTTGPNAQLTFQAHDGIVAVLGANSHLQVEKLSVSANGIRNTLVHLKAGNLATSLDPAKKNLNNYGVRTDQGLALARGTTMTVSVNENVYTVSVLAGNVTVNWSTGLSVSIVGNTPSDVTSFARGRVNTVDLNAALASGQTPGLPEALIAAAAAVASVATHPAQVTNIIAAIATSAGAGSSASSTVAGATAAATELAVKNPSLIESAGSPTALAATLSTTAVRAATAAGNGSASAFIVSSVVHAVANALPNTNVSAVASALTTAANTVPGAAPVTPSQAVAGATSPLPIGRATASVTPFMPLDPAINVSASGGI